MKYDYLIVGAGLFGAVFANRMTANGKTCLVIDKRSHIAGNCYTEDIEGIDVHKFGAHIFHTSNEDVWQFANKFDTFRPFINSPMAKFGDEIYNMPFNMNTFSKMWGIQTPSEAKAIIDKQVADSGITEPKNLEEKAISMVGRDIYTKLVKGYTEKQWGKSCDELPGFIIGRLPLRFTYDNNYFNDRYQGIPESGYTTWIANMLEGIEVRLDTDYKTFLAENPDIAGKILYTGSVDELLDYRFGALEYRSLRFDTKTLDTDNFQGNAVINYTDRETPFTRVIEHKFFNPKNQEKTIISYEYPTQWEQGMEAYYPINSGENPAKYEQYVAYLNENHPEILLGGRLGLYSYLDMDKIIARALELSNAQ